MRVFQSNDENEELKIEIATLKKESAELRTFVQNWRERTGRESAHCIAVTLRFSITPSKKILILYEHLNKKNCGSLY